MENNLFTDQVLINMFQNIWDIDNQNQEKNAYTIRYKKTKTPRKVKETLGIITTKYQV